jgi:hypothetical protein
MDLEYKPSLTDANEKIILDRPLINIALTRHSATRRKRLFGDDLRFKTPFGLLFCQRAHREG